jgi:pimeloyl-ACP methyl ester carboxylesterase
VASQPEQHSFRVPLAIRLFFKILAPLWPALGTRVALYLFFRPIPYPIPKRERAFRAKWQVGFVSFKGEELPVYAKGTGPQTVLLVHGWSGRGSQFFEMAEALVQSGWRVITFDAPAHGTSKRKRSEMPEFVEVILQLEAQMGPITSGIGHSLGGVALANAMNRGLPLKQLVLMGSPATITQVTRDFCTRVEAPAVIFNRIMAFLRKNYHIEPDELGAANQVQLRPVAGLLIYDRDDRDVDLSEGELLHSVWSGSQLIVTDGLGHRRILRNEGVIHSVVAFLKG